MEVGARRGSLIPERVNVGHDVVAEPTLVACGRSKVGVVQMGPHLIDGLFRDVQAQLTLRFGQGEPQPAPERNAPRLTPQRLHCR